MFVLPPRALIGMLHLPPLPGAPAGEWPLARIIEYTCEDARRLAAAGFSALMVENFGDAPFRATCVDPHTIACMTVVARAIRGAVDLPLGINVLRNDPLAALAIATVTGARYVRVNVHAGVYATDQGIIEGRADETLRYRKRIGACGSPQPVYGDEWPPTSATGGGRHIAIFADVHVKHAEPLSCHDIAEAAEETAYRGRADGLIVSGTGTGKPTRLDDLRKVRAAVPDRPLIVGSGATPETAGKLLTVADALIVGTAIKQDGQTTAPVDVDRARRFVDAVEQA